MTAASMSILPGQFPVHLAGGTKIIFENNNVQHESSKISSMMAFDGNLCDEEERARKRTFQN